MSWGLNIEDSHFLFSDDLINTILEINRKTTETGIEHGAAFCCDATNDYYTDLDPGSICSGSLCSIDVQKSSCPGSSGLAKRKCGDVHGHPGGLPSPSAGDMLSSIQQYLKTFFSFPAPRVNCQTGSEAITCEVIKGQYEQRFPEIKEKYIEMADQYMKDIEPFYAKWRATGTCPVITEEFKTKKTALILSLLDMFTFETEELSTLRDRLPEDYIAPAKPKKEVFDWAAHKQGLQKLKGGTSRRRREERGYK